jgi:hypothetical protein
MGFEMREAWCFERNQIFLVVGLWKSGKREGFMVLELKK